MITPILCFLQSAPLILLIVFSQVTCLSAGLLGDVAEGPGRLADTSNQIKDTPRDLAMDSTHHACLEPSSSSELVHGLTHQIHRSPPSSTTTPGPPRAFQKFIDADQPAGELLPNVEAQQQNQLQRITDDRDDRWIPPWHMFLDKCASSDHLEQITFVQEAFEKLLNLNYITYATGRHWLETFEKICQRQEDFPSRLRMVTLVSFGYRDFMSKLSSPAMAPKGDIAQLHELLSTLQSEREAYHRTQFQSAYTPRGMGPQLEIQFQKVDWAQEALLPSTGLGNSADVKSFQRMVQGSSAIKDYFKRARSKFSWSMVLAREAKFIERLGRAANKANGKTNSQVKTASIILLWHLKTKGRDAFEGFFEDFAFTKKAQKLATKQVQLLLHPTKQPSLCRNDLALLHALEAPDIGNECRNDLALLHALEAPDIGNEKPRL